MNVSVKEMNRSDLIVVEGRVDSVTAPELGKALSTQIDRGKKNLVIDLSGVDYMSSAGLRELVTALKRVKPGGGDLRIAAPSERVREVLELAGLDSIFKVYDDQVGAVGSY
jgi:anti-sigma B factor antagonist